MGQPSRHPEAHLPRLRTRRWLALTIVAIVSIATALAAVAAPASRPSPADDAGLPFIHNFDPAEYGGSPQNWSITQDRDGVIYVGNAEDGVLTFDGVRWRRIQIPDQLVVRSLAAMPDGRIYAGTVGDFGWLGRAPDGRMTYHSLLDKVPRDARDFSDVWSIHVTDDGVYFATVKYLFHLQGGKIRVIKPATSFHLTFTIEGRLYARVVDRGLMRMVDDKLQMFPGGQLFADKRIYALLPWPADGGHPGGLLAGTRSHGWFVFDGKDWKAWHTDAKAALDKAAIYGATRLADGRIAVATLQGGLFLLDAQGHLLRHLTRSSGLTTGMVLALYQDRQRGLWLATGNGVTRIDVDLPLTHFGERSGLLGGAVDITRHDGSLYVGTFEGLFRLLPGSAGSDARFERLPAVTGQVWSLLSMDGQLLAAGTDGVFAVDPDGNARQLESVAPHTVASALLQRSRQNPARVFVGYRDGLGSLLWSGGKWIDEGRIAGFKGDPRSLFQDGKGGLWMGLWTGGVVHLDLPADWQGPQNPRPPALRSYDTASGLPDTGVSVASVGGNVRFLTSKGIYRFDPANHHFAPDPAFRDLFGGAPRGIATLYQDREGALWMYTTNSAAGLRETGRAVRVDGKWQWRVTPLQPIAGNDVFVFHEDADGVVWMGGYKGVFRYDRSRHAGVDTPFRVLIREVAARDGRALDTRGGNASASEIPYAQNALRFEFAAPSFDFSSANTFQVLLQGIDRGWSPWSGDAYRDYTNIREGDYRFRVRARNVYGEEGTEAVFDFRVLPPWYRTWWAWMIWVAAGVLVVGLLLRWRSAALRRRNQELAALVEQRTAELQKANSALAEQSVTDPLTGLKNRRYLYDHIAQDIAVSRRDCQQRQRGRQSLPLNTGILFLMVDIDHFKQVNDTHGHAAGDSVLRQFRDILRAVVRETDIAVRWGGEEFLIAARFALPDAGPGFAERIRAAVAAHSFDLGDGRSVRCTCSVGFATYPMVEDDPDQLGWEQVVNLADECLYAAKRHGRNAWSGVLSGASSCEGDIRTALRESLERFPEPGPLPVAASWARPKAGD